MNIYAFLLAPQQEEWVSQDPSKSLSLYMGSPRLQGSVVTARQKSHHQRTH
jgi:hypothetical protein